jgi:glyceraldehyde-3-phosphate dehydrogenase (NAD(P))
MHVAVLGMGIIGQRLAGAINAQPDMDLSGIAVRSVSPAVLKNPSYQYFASEITGKHALAERGIDSHGDLSALLAESDVIVDCGQAGTGVGRYDTYMAAGVKAIFCGGERKDELGPLISPHLNYDKARNATSLRLLSCNTTALARVAASLGASNVTEVEAIILRCGGYDSPKPHGVVVHPGASHHAADLRSVLRGIKVDSTAVTVPMSAGHVIHARVKLLRGASHADIVSRLARNARITVHRSDEPLDTAALAASTTATASSSPPCRYEVAARVQSSVEQSEVQAWLSLDHAAITIPETIDAIRAICGEHGADEARSITDAALGLSDAPHDTTRAAVIA